MNKILYAYQVKIVNLVNRDNKDAYNGLWFKANKQL